MEEKKRTSVIIDISPDKKKKPKDPDDWDDDDWDDDWLDKVAHSLDSIFNEE